MSHISRQTQKELDQELRVLSEYPTMKPKGNTIIPTAKFLTLFVEAGSLENLQKRMPQGDISFEYYTKWADGFKAIDRELDKNKALNDKVKKAPQDVSQYLNCITLTLRLTKKAEDLGKYVPETIKWGQVAHEYKALYQEILKIDADYAKIFPQDITKPTYLETPEAQALAEWGHYQALNYLGQYHQQQSLSADLDAEAVKEHNFAANRLLNQAAAQGSNDAMQLIGAKAIQLNSSLTTTSTAMDVFRTNYEIASRRGHSVAMVGLGFSLLNKHQVIVSETKETRTTRAKIEHALHLLYRAAKDDATMAHVHLAGYYYTQKMIDKAIEHYTEAVRNEHVPSMLFLARIYMEQSQAGHDKTDMVLNYFQMAMSAGNIEARFHIATVYSNTVEWLSKYRNYTAAFAHAFSTASMKFEDISDKDQRQFITFSKILLGDFYRDGTTVDKVKDVQKAIEWYKAGIQDFETHPDAFAKAPEEIKQTYYQLGMFYSDLSKEQDSAELLAESLEYFKRAAQLGHLPAMQIQTKLYEDSLTEFTAENALERIRMHEVLATQAFLEGDGTLAILERKKIAALFGSKTLNPKPDYKKSLQVYNTMIQSHQDVEAAYISAKMYEDGKTETGAPDVKEAMRHYTLCVKFDQSAEKRYAILAYSALGEMAFDGRSFGKPNYKVALNCYHKIRELGDPQGYVMIGIMNLSTGDPAIPPNIPHAMANFREAKKRGFVFTSEDLTEISEEIEKFSGDLQYEEDYVKAIHYDFQLLIDSNFIDKLLNEITTSISALLIVPPYLITDTVMVAEDRARFLNQYLERLTEISIAYEGRMITEVNANIMILIDRTIAACASALNLRDIQYAAHKNLSRLYLLQPTPNYEKAKQTLNLLIYQYQDSESAHVLGQMEEQGHNKTGQSDYQEALRAYQLGIREEITDLNVVKCLIAIGNLAYTGKGMPEGKPDLQYALKQYRIVANMGYFHAYTLIGFTHLTQTDSRMPVNIDLAMAWLRQADDHVESSPETLTRVHQHLEILKSFDHFKESYSKAISYDVRFLEDYLWLSNLFFSAGCKPSEEEKGMIPKYIKWIEVDAHLDDTDRENLLNGFKQYYKNYLPKA